MVFFGNYSVQAFLAYKSSVIRHCEPVTDVTGSQFASFYTTELCKLRKEETDSHARLRCKSALTKSKICTLT